MKTIQCQCGCGTTFEATGPNSKYTPACAARKRRENTDAHTKRRKERADKFDFSAEKIDRYTIRTRKQVAGIMGITEEGVRLIEMSALGKIHKALAKFAQ